MSELQIDSDRPIAAYDKFRAQLAELKQHNSSMVFDYSDDKGNKDARSHVYQLRKTKTAIDNARKNEKKSSLDYGRRVDSEAGEIISEVEEMIEVHAAPLKAIEEKEKSRKAAIEERFDEIVGIRQITLHAAPIALIKDHIEDLKNLEPDDSFDEYMAEATREFKISMQYLQDALTQAEKAESEKAELERLRKEQVARDQKEREERIAEDARVAAEQKAELKIKAAEQKAKDDIIAAEDKAERIELEKQEAIEREAIAKREAENAKKEAVEREKQAKKEAVILEARRVEEKKQAVIDAEARVKREAEEKAKCVRLETEKRERNKKRRAKVHNDAVDGLVANGIDGEIAKEVITIIAKKIIDNVYISY